MNGDEVLVPVCETVENTANPEVIEIINIFTSWDLSIEVIQLLLNCGITSTNILKNMHSHDVDEIFSEKSLIGKKITFRYKLQNWRLENKYDALTCCPSDRTLTDRLSMSSWVDGLQTPTTSQVGYKNSIKEILGETFKGQQVLAAYDIKQHLSNSEQNALSHCVIDHHLTVSKERMSPRKMLRYAQEITEAFPNEVKDTYYKPRNKIAKKNASGKLYDRYFNLSRKIKSSTPSLLSGSQETEVNDLNEIEGQISQEEFENAKTWLMHNIEPESIVIEKWKQTTQKRIAEMRNNFEQNISVILDEWPRYKDSFGYLLIDIDFKWLFPNKEMALLENFTNMSTLMITIFEEEIKDKLNLDLLEKFKRADITNDSRSCILIFLMHAVLLPPRLTKKSRPTITDAQQDAVIHLLAQNNLGAKLDELRKGEGKIQPVIIVVGDKIENITNFYTYFDGILYKLPTIIRCIDMILKICFVFNLKFSAKSKFVWEFFQLFFFDIEIPSVSSKVLNLLNKLKNLQR